MIKLPRKAEVLSTKNPAAGLAAVAVFGTGSIGTRHLRVLSEGLKVPVLAVPKREERRLELEAEGKRAVRNAREAAEQGARLGIVASDTSSHLNDSLTALEAGMALLVEKPLACTAREGLKIKRKAQSLKGKIFVANVMRFSEALGCLRQWLGRIGPLHSVHIECRSYLPSWRPQRDYRRSYSAHKNEGGVLRDLIHEVDYAGWLFGWPAAVFARLHNFGRLGIESEEAAQLSWRAPGGALVSLYLDYISPVSKRSMSVHGSNGNLEWNALTGTVTRTLKGKSSEMYRSSQTRDEMFAEQARAFIAGSRDSWDGRLTPVEEGIKALAVCDAARLSARSKREARVNYP